VSHSELSLQSEVYSNALRVTMAGDHIECYYNGRKYLDVNDSTFKDAGKTGLWTKADAQTRFDDLRVSGN
jgi:hypothetical protein